MIDKNDVLLNISQLREVVSNASKSGDKDILGYYEQMLRMQEYILVEMVSMEEDKGHDVTVSSYFTDNFGIITPERAKILIKNLGSLRGINLWL